MALEAAGFFNFEVDGEWPDSDGELPEQVKPGFSRNSSKPLNLISLGGENTATCGQVQKTVQGVLDVCTAPGRGSLSEVTSFAHGDATAADDTDCDSECPSCGDDDAAPGITSDERLVKGNRTGVAKRYSGPERHVEHRYHCCAADKRDLGIDYDNLCKGRLPVR
eukprot:gnl/TRDRNA2_/TRDRNA2_164156_c0_seq1.p1 gnl/TRDRNA2_/TRDRNA2_164156_c0~~gnl/TRDRNA2_/TRDRNA2_164156_c0_seq1.p1  ORF type:complete len:165 (-),score=15.53 gnl/TRDRNA2_/TRDRNA2_164156_c0_seq1:514-1008(-)